MKNCKIKKLQDEMMNSVVSGGDAKFIATATGAGITCGAGVLGAAFFIAAMISQDKYIWRLYKTSAAFAAISLAGLVSTAAISKI